MADSTTTTEVVEATPELMDEIFGGLSGTSAPVSPFARKNEFAVLDSPEEVEEPEEEEKEEDIVNQVLGDPKEGKPATVAEPVQEGFLSKLIEKGVLLPFDGDKKPEEYDAAEMEELILANIEDAKAVARQEAVSDLPEEISYMIEYVRNGGTDITGTLSMLGAVREHRELDVENPEHHEAIVRSYLMLKEDQEEVIESDIAALKDRKGAMEAKAKLVKPLLDKVMKEEADRYLKEQKAYSDKVRENRANFVASVKTIVDKGEINGIKLDAKLKSMLLDGMTGTHKSAAGKNTSLMGKLLEEYTVTKPNLPLVMEALFLLQNPEEYRARIRQAGANTEAEKQRKLLKQAETDKGAPTGDIDEIADTTNRKRTLPPPPKSILQSINDRNKR